jgi:phosphatidylserine/phosphatidylglycerophosphate/cardiolipin synthase-like enzyme
MVTTDSAQWSPDRWFLTSAERGNDLTALDLRADGRIAWTTGNRVHALVHGAAYFAELLAAVRDLRPGDHLFFTDWRGDADERLAGPGTEIATVLADAAARGVLVRGLLWRAHADIVRYHERANRLLGEQIQAAGGECPALAGPHPAPDVPAPCPVPLPAPPPCGTDAVQVLRTFPHRRRGYAFAPGGERSIARAHLKALGLARRLVYLEDQYIWSPRVAAAFAQALAERPELRLIAVLPHHPDRDSAFYNAPQLFARAEVMSLLHRAGAGRVAFYGIENPAGTPVYVHAKVTIIDARCRRGR